MNDIVNGSVESRKNAIYDNYDIKDEKLKKELDDFFKRLEEYASSFNDVMEFETSFASSPLSGEYTSLFTKIMTSGEPLPEEKGNEVVNDIKEEVKDEINYQARRISRENTDRVLRDTPIVGDVIQARQTIDLFNKFRRKKDEDK